MTTKKTTNETPAKAEETTTAKAPQNLPDQKEVDKLIQKYAAISSATALIPVPAFDILAFVGVQVKMLNDLGKLHNVDIQDNKAKVAVSSLVSAVPAGSFTVALASVVKIVPGVGSALGALAGPAYYAAATYAVGKVFHSHFSSGGVLLNFNPEEFKEAYKGYFDEKSETTTASK